MIRPWADCKREEGAPRRAFAIGRLSFARGRWLLLAAAAGSAAIAGAALRQLLPPPDTPSGPLLPCRRLRRAC